MFEITNLYKEDIDTKEIEKVLKIAIEKLKLKNIEFNIIFVDNDYIHKINKEYRNIDRETDVISFALDDDNSFPTMETDVLGDIYISIDKAKSQSEEYGHSFKRELCFLAVHGFLHINGYDHMNEEDEKEMFGLQEEILNEAGITR